MDLWLFTPGYPTLAIHLQSSIQIQSGSISGHNPFQEGINLVSPISGCNPSPVATLLAAMYPASVIRFHLPGHCSCMGRILCLRLLICHPSKGHIY